MDIENGEPTAVPKERPRVWIGVVVIAIGVLLLAYNLGYHRWLDFLQNWWALLLLIPAAGKFHQAWNCLRAGFGLRHSAVREPLFTGLAFTLVAAMFLLGLDWLTWWPLFVILGGLSLMTSDRQR
jgi:uncharacterized membrane protein YhaH (DUF805 family)